MRAILVLIGIVAIAAVVLMSLGMLRIEQTTPGALPSVAFDVKGGKIPQWKAQTGSVRVESQNATIQVPTVEMTNRSIQVPRLKVEPAANAATPAPAGQ